MEQPARTCLLPNNYEEMWHFRKKLQKCAAYRLHNLVPSLQADRVSVP